jgi:MFS family permease
MNVVDDTAEGLTANTMFGSLRYPGTTRYFVGVALSMVGTWMQSVALAWLVSHELGGNGRQLGIVAMCQFGPMLVLGMYAGSLSDHKDKRNLMLVTQVFMGAAALALAWVDFASHETFPIIYGLSLLAGITSAFDTPVRRALIGDLVPRHAVANAMSLNTGVMTSTRVVGMAVGGFVIRFGGTRWCFLLNGVSYLAMMFALVGLKHRSHATKAKASGDGVWSALVHVWRTPILKVVIIATALAATITFNYQATFPLMIDKVFRLNADVLGLLFAVTSVGSFTGAWISARQKKPTIERFALGCVMLGIGAGCFAIARSFEWALVAVVPLGVGGGLLMAQMSGILTEYSEPTMRGRVLALQSVVFLGSTFFGGPLIGEVADAVSVRWASGIGGIAGLTAGIGAFVASRRLGVSHE